jgi:hypothetical protein
MYFYTHMANQNYAHNSMCNNNLILCTYVYFYMHKCIYTWLHKVGVPFGAFLDIIGIEISSNSFF